MKIGIDMSPLQTGHKTRGTGVYTYLLFDALRSLQQSHQFVSVTEKEIPNDIDIIHYPFFDPFLLTLPMRKKKPTVVTVHDLIPIAYPNDFPRGIKGNIRWAIQKQSLSSARAVITDSMASRDDIVRYASYDKRNIHVIPLAPHPHIHRITENALINKTREMYNLPKRFVLYVGDINKNKNIPKLLQAFSKLHKEPAFADIKLVFVGKAFLEPIVSELQEINKVIKEHSLDTHILKLGFVPDELLSVVYSLATAYIQPSYAEGFGLPVLDAMACECPTIVADISSLHEISGPSYKIDPYNVSSMAQGMHEIVSKNWSEADKKKFPQWASMYTWNRVARDTVKVYESVLRKI